MGAVDDAVKVGYEYYVKRLAEAEAELARVEGILSNPGLSELSKYPALIVHQSKISLVETYRKAVEHYRGMIQE